MTSKSEERLQALRRLVAERPDEPRLQFGLAVELLNRRDTRNGVAALRAYLAAEEDEGNAWSRLGSALAELGEVEEARTALRKGIEVAEAHGHEALVEEMSDALEDLE